MASSKATARPRLRKKPDLPFRHKLFKNSGPKQTLKSIRLPLHLKTNGNRTAFDLYQDLCELVHKNVMSDHRFSYDREHGFLVEIPQQGCLIKYKRASLKKLEPYLIHKIILLKDKSRVSMNQPRRVEDDQSYTWWCAQAIFYAVNITLHKEDMMVAMQQKMIGGTLKVPPYLRHLRAKLKREAMDEDDSEDNLTNESVSVKSESEDDVAQKPKRSKKKKNSNTRDDDTDETLDADDEDEENDESHGDGSEKNSSGESSSEGSSSGESSSSGSSSEEGVSEDGTSEEGSSENDAPPSKKSDTIKYLEPSTGNAIDIDLDELEVKGTVRCDSPAAAFVGMDHGRNRRDLHSKPRTKRVASSSKLPSATPLQPQTSPLTKPSTLSNPDLASKASTLSRAVPVMMGAVGPGDQLMTFSTFCVSSPADRGRQLSAESEVGSSQYQTPRSRAGSAYSIPIIDLRGNSSIHEISDGVSDMSNKPVVIDLTTDSPIYTSTGILPGMRDQRSARTGGTTICGLRGQSDGRIANSNLDTSSNDSILDRLEREIDDDLFNANSDAISSREAAQLLANAQIGRPRRRKTTRNTTTAVQASMVNPPGHRRVHSPLPSAKVNHVYQKDVSPPPFHPSPPPLVPVHEQRLPIKPNLYHPSARWRPKPHLDLRKMVSEVKSRLPRMLYYENEIEYCLEIHGYDVHKALTAYARANGILVRGSDYQGLQENTEDDEETLAGIALSLRKGEDLDKEDAASLVHPTISAESKVSCSTGQRPISNMHGLQSTTASDTAHADFSARSSRNMPSLATNSGQRPSFCTRPTASYTVQGLPPKPNVSAPGASICDSTAEAASSAIPPPAITGTDEANQRCNLQDDVKQVAVEGSSAHKGEAFDPSQSKAERKRGTSSRRTPSVAEAGNRIELLDLRKRRTVFDDKAGRKSEQALQLISGTRTTPGVPGQFPRPCQHHATVSRKAFTGHTPVPKSGKARREYMKLAQRVRASPPSSIEFQGAFPTDTARVNKQSKLNDNWRVTELSREKTDTKKNTLDLTMKDTVEPPPVPSYSVNGVSNAKETAESCTNPFRSASSLDKGEMSLRETMRLFQQSEGRRLHAGLQRRPGQLHQGSLDPTSSRFLLSPHHSLRDELSLSSESPSPGSRTRIDETITRIQERDCMTKCLEHAPQEGPSPNAVTSQDMALDKDQAPTKPKSAGESTMKQVREAVGQGAPNGSASKYQSVAPKGSKPKKVTFTKPDKAQAGRISTLDSTSGIGKAQIHDPFSHSARLSGKIGAIREGHAEVRAQGSLRSHQPPKRPSEATPDSSDGAPTSSFQGADQPRKETETSSGKDTNKQDAADRPFKVDSQISSTSYVASSSTAAIRAEESGTPHGNVRYTTESGNTIDMSTASKKRRRISDTAAAASDEAMETTSQSLEAEQPAKKPRKSKKQEMSKKQENAEKKPKKKSGNKPVKQPTKMSETNAKKESKAPDVMLINSSKGAGLDVTNHPSQLDTHTTNHPDAPLPCPFRQNETTKQTFKASKKRKRQEDESPAEKGTPRLAAILTDEQGPPKLRRRKSNRKDQDTPQKLTASQQTTQVAEPKTKVEDHDNMSDPHDEAWIKEYEKIVRARTGKKGRRQHCKARKRAAKLAQKLTELKQAGEEHSQQWYEVKEKKKELEAKIELLLAIRFASDVG